MKKITLLSFLMAWCFQSQGQFQKKQISFESANPFSLSDIILDLENQERQTVFGKLTIPIDSLNPDQKYPLIIGVARSFKIILSK